MESAQTDDISLRWRVNADPRKLHGCLAECVCVCLQRDEERGRRVVSGCFMRCMSGSG